MFTLIDQDPVVGTRTFDFHFEDVLTVGRLANGLNQCKFDSTEFMSLIGKWWPMAMEDFKADTSVDVKLACRGIRARLWGKLHLMITTIASCTK